MTFIVPTSPIYNHTPDMGEISGFGEGYEQCCQDMLNAGTHWVLAHPNADVQIAGYKNVTGLITFLSEEAKELEQVLLEAAKMDATGAMMETVVQRLAYINANSWDGYCEALRTIMKEKDYEADLGTPAPSEPPSDEFSDFVSELITDLQAVFGTDRVIVISDPEDINKLDKMFGIDQEKPR